MYSRDQQSDTLNADNPANEFRAKYARQWSRTTPVEYRRIAGYAKNEAGSYRADRNAAHRLRYVSHGSLPLTDIVTGPRCSTPFVRIARLHCTMVRKSTSMSIGAS